MYVYVFHEWGATYVHIPHKLLYDTVLIKFGSGVNVGVAMRQTSESRAVQQLVILTRKN